MLRPDFCEPWVKPLQKSNGTRPLFQLCVVQLQLPPIAGAWNSYSWQEFSNLAQQFGRLPSKREARGYITGGVLMQDAMAPKFKPVFLAELTAVRTLSACMSA